MYGIPKKTYRGLENSGKDQQEDDIQEVNCTNRDVEDVDTAVHPWTKNADANERTCFNEEECNCLNSAIRLCKGNKNGLEENVDQEGYNKVVGCGSELDVEESPFVKTGGIGIQDIAWVFVHVG